MSRARIGLLILIVAGLGWMLLRRGCAHKPETPQEEIEQRFSEIKEAAREKHLGTLKDFISASYLDPHKLRKADVEQIMASYALAQKSLYILLRMQSIEMKSADREAHVVVLAAMAARPVDDPSLLPSLHADIYRFDADLRKEGEVWRVTSAIWEEATVEDFSSQGE